MFPLGALDKCNLNVCPLFYSLRTIATLVGHTLFPKRKKMLLFAGRNSLLELFPFAPVVYLHEELVHPRTKQE